MKKRKGKTKRWLAGILSAVLVIGSINLVDALEGSNGESALYDAPELTITQGAETYDLKTKTRTVETIREGITPRPAITLIMRVLITDPTVLTAAIQETMQMPDREIRVLTAAMQETVRMPDREIQVRTAAMQKILQMRSAERMQHRVRRIP